MSNDKKFFLRKQIFSYNYSDFSFEEISNLIKQHNLINHKTYIKFCFANEGKLDNKQMPKKPWLLSNEPITCIQYFKMLFPNKNKSTYIKKTRLSMEEHIDAIKNHSVYTIKDYQKFYSENKNKINGLFANPWIKFNMSAWDFLDLAIPERAKIRKEQKDYGYTKEELIELIKNNNLFSSRTYRKFYLENKDKFPIPSRPWDRFFMKESEFFDLHFPQRIKTTDLEEIKNIFLQNNISSNKKFQEYLKNNSNSNISLTFYKSFNMKFSEFLDLVWGKNRIKEKDVISLSDFISLLRENKIFSFSQYKNFYKQNKSLITRMPGNPMVSYKMSQPEIFKMAFPICEKFPKGRIHHKTKREDIIIFLSQNNVQDIFQYKEIEKELPLIKDILKTNDDNIDAILQEVAASKNN